MDNARGHTINLANSIIGVSILAMPYCFRQCGILLSICLLLISSIISRLACHFLLKSAIMARRKTFEFLAFHIFGSLGKFSIEIGMIGFLLGTCVAFFVVMGDLGPAILSEMTGARIGNALRNSTLIALAVFCVLPLGLLRNVDSLNGVSTATIGFYICLVMKIVIEALPHIFTGDWVGEVILWRPAGILQCLPIFSMALFCQTQLFEIYQAIPNASLEKMNSMIRVAVNMCTWVYIFVGAFGYIAFFQKPFTGNILLSFAPAVTSDVMKMGFVLSLAFSFPLVIFPCRASLYSLLYKGTSYTNLHEGGTTNYIPEGKFKMLTLVIVSVSLTIGIIIPSIELVLGLIGSTIGVMICVLFPVTCFICISPKNTNERILAQIMLFVGIIVMVLGTYANLHAIEEANLNSVTEKIPPLADIKPKVEPEKPVVLDIPTTVKPAISEEIKQKPPDEVPKQADNPPDSKVENKEPAKEVRHEPPQPEEPVENPEMPKTEKSKIDQSQPKEINSKENKQGPVVEPLQPLQEKIKDDKQGPVVEPVQPLDNKIKENKQTPVVTPVRLLDDKIKEKQEPVVEPVQPSEVEEHHEEEKQNVIKEFVETKRDESKPGAKVNEKKRSEEVDIEAIKKEESELKAQEEKGEKDRNQILIDTLQKQNEVQKEMVEQQKKILEVIQKHQESVKHQDADKVNEEKVKAVKEIEDIAKRAIETISGKDNKNVEKEIKDDKKSGDNKIQDNVVVSKLEEKAEIKTEKRVDKKEANANIADNKDVKVINDETKNVREVKLENENHVSAQKNKENASRIELVPLPIALAKLHNVTAGSKLADVNKTVPEDENGDVKAMRRDILEDNSMKHRAKREISENKQEAVNKAVKEVCDEMSKSTSTEKPIIKMLCKLSEPNLVNIADLGVSENKNLPDLKPQKRDLKEFSQK